MFINPVEGFFKSIKPRNNIKVCTMITIFKFMSD